MSLSLRVQLWQECLAAQNVVKLFRNRLQRQICNILNLEIQSHQRVRHVLYEFQRACASTDTITVSLLESNREICVRHIFPPIVQLNQYSTALDRYLTLEELCFRTAVLYLILLQDRAEEECFKPLV